MSRIPLEHKISEFRNRLGGLSKSHAFNLFLINSLNYYKHENCIFGNNLNNSFNIWFPRYLSSCSSLPSASLPSPASSTSHFLEGEALLLLLFCFSFPPKKYIMIYILLKNPTHGWNVSSTDQRSRLRASKQKRKSFTCKTILHLGFPPQELLEGWDGGVAHPPAHSLALAGLRQQAKGMQGLRLTAELPCLSGFTCLHTRGALPPFFGRPGVYQLVSKVTLVAAAGPTCNYTASLGDCCWVARVLSFNLF